MENCVVGAPCGVMDQMAAALGEAGSLLALRCQPAEVQPPVALPPHIRLWGIDSGIRHRCAQTAHLVTLHRPTTRPVEPGNLVRSIMALLRY